MKRLWARSRAASARRSISSGSSTPAFPPPDRPRAASRAERRPPSAGVLGELRVVIVGDLDLDHALDRLVGAGGGLGALAHIGQQLLVELRGLTAGADEAIAGAARELGGQGAGGGDVDRDRL